MHLNRRHRQPGLESGPLLAQLIDRMRRLGLGERVLKTALAAGVSWQLALWVPGNEHPYVAPVVAVLLMQLTIAQSVELAIQRNIGTAIGIAISVITYAALGIHAGSIALATLLSLAVGIQLGLGQPGVQQVAVTGLIVLLAGSINGTVDYAAYRIADAIIGAVVALGLNWLVAPPLLVAPARGAIERMAHDLALALTDLTDSLLAGMTAERAAAHLASTRALAASLADANAALAQADQSLRFNRFARQRRDELSRLRRASQALEHSAIQTRVIARSIATAYEEDAAGWLAPEHFGQALADLFGRITALVRGVGGDRMVVRPELAETAPLHEQMRGYWQERADRGWLYAGEVLAVAERMANELQLAIDDRVALSQERG